MENNGQKEVGRMPASKKLVFNPDYCGGCLSCEVACATRHFGAYNPNLSAIRVKADFFSYEFTGFACVQCKSASCVAACPPKIQAISFDESTGARYIDQDKCIHCGQCVKACPFAHTQYPPIHMTSYDGKKVVIKCDLCHGYADGPACIAACVKTALTVE